MTKPDPAITEYLHRLGAGEEGAFERLLPLVYRELRAVAERQLRGERAGHSLQATELVHEAYLKLVDAPAAGFENRRHFLRVAARAMRQVLIDHARAKRTQKRGGEWQRISLVHAEPEALAPLSLDLVGLDEALHRLAESHPHCVEVVELRTFSGLTLTEIAELTGRGRRTVDRDWSFALAWLFRELDTDED